METIGSGEDIEKTVIEKDHAEMLRTRLGDFRERPMRDNASSSILASWPKSPSHWRDRQAHQQDDGTGEADRGRNPEETRKNPEIRLHSTVSARRALPVSR